jgi:prepilin-type N-terminal cleavage/methylation domain-containing protein
MRRGFTLIELLVVIAIIGVLVISSITGRPN